MPRRRHGHGRGCRRAAAIVRYIASESGTPLYKDDSHLSRSYAISRATYIDAALDVQLTAPRRGRLQFRGAANPALAWSTLRERLTNAWLRDPLRDHVTAARLPHSTSVLSQ
jgi:hypothetical protein